MSIKSVPVDVWPILLDYMNEKTLLNLRLSHSWTGEAEVHVMIMRRLLTYHCSRLNETRKAVPALYAQVGDRFVHRLPTQFGAYDIFEYRGRTTGRHVGLCCRSLSIPNGYRRCTHSHSRGPGPHFTPDNWIIFKFIHGSSAGFGNAYRGSSRGGMRDLIDAWPVSKYWVFDEDGQYDEAVICLPPSKCYGFRRMEERIINSQYGMVARLSDVNDLLSGVVDGPSEN